ncbi:MAG: PSD1 and planctomycete cytochrome C domain-containing protein [Planctomycetes bacterium]|nr:PSD1 and planctomycete cytochrome C domain-containing protein [Planctomycetota bacterium]
MDHFESKVRPVLVKSCQKCHGPEKQRGGLRLDTKAAWQAGGDTGPALVPGKPDESLIIKAIRNPDPKLRMPPNEKLADHEIAALVEWVKDGAVDPRVGVAQIGGMSLDAAKQWWSFQPVKRPVVPEVRNSQTQPRNPIDNFVLAKLSDKGLSLTPPADKRTLLRRVTYDLTGLPPSPADLDAFLNDTSPEAFAKVVDRLLASPQYGERWGRHWLDLVRYADTAGENSDHPLPHAWRYRNWVIEAFNRDLPYDQFLRDQIAGDILWARAEGERRKDEKPRTTILGFDASFMQPPSSFDQRVATGYLAIARRFGHDTDKDMHLTFEDTIDTVGKTLLGLSIGCARCHDHKYDAITAKDYYALYGIFESTRFAFPGCEAKQQPRDLVKLQPLRPELAYAVVEGTAKNAKLQLRGDPEKPGAEVPRRWLEVLGGQTVPANSGSGRLELAGWLTSNANPLTPRVMVNRIWQHHFGKGLVQSPNDFGARGMAPTHPELLDWLSAEFVASGWRIRHFHKLIVLSAAYQQGSESRAEAVKVDVNNNLYWRFDRRRLSGEEIRDSLLAVSGQLDRTPGHEHPFPPEKSWGFTQHAPFNTVYETDRRSVYVISIRNRRHPFLGLFDGADPNATTPQRQVTTVPTQALYFLNDPFFHKQAEKLSASVFAKPEATRLDELFRITLLRPPTAKDRTTADAFLTSYAAQLSEPVADRPKIAWAALTRVLLASNEFLYLD